MKKLMALLLIFPLVSFAQDYTTITEYANRTAKDYCGTNAECKSDFSQKLIWAYKDGESDSKSRFKNTTLLKRYEKKWYTIECSSAKDEDKCLCYSMVDRLVDSYNRGLSNR